MFAQKMTKTSLPLAVFLTAMALASCAPLQATQDYPENNSGTFDDGGSLLDLFKGGDEKSTPAKAESDSTESEGAVTIAPMRGGLGVNAVLWEASLDTLSFMPLASADPIGGVIITDWYNDPGAPGERVKINLVISGLELRADALRVSIFREKRVGNQYLSLAASSKAARQMENIILTRARDLATATR